MTAMAKIISGASSASTTTWKDIDWIQVTEEVKRLQVRIAKAAREKRHNKAKALQWLLTHSFSARLLAVKRVALNSGAKTPGVDGVVWKTQNQKMQAVHSLQRRGYQPQPLRRVYIPKKQKGSFRPLSIPCLIDRAMQALHLLALEPVMETLADKHAYGFRPERSCADAIAQCFNVLARETSATFILEGDIRACFDRLSGKWLEDNTLMDKVILSKWLTAGYMEEKALHPTFNGVPQGGVISPAILVLALKGMEKTVRNVTSPRDKVNVVSYADDFVITGATKEVLENKVMPAVTAFLKERGLELSPEKTLITHVDHGFDFLGFNVRKYKGKLLIKPSKENIKVFLDKTRSLIKSNATMKTENLIRLLNPKIRGWANYYRHVVSQATFDYVDHCIFKALIRWINRRHPEKNAAWKYQKYFRVKGMNRWTFSVKTKNRMGKYYFLDLFRMSRLPIRRHIKIKSEANPYDPKDAEYFSKRERLKMKLRIQDREFLKTQSKGHQAKHQTVGSCIHGLRKA